MEWHKACVNPRVATSRYEVVPPLDPIRIFHVDVSDGGLFSVDGVLPRLPDRLNLPAGRVADYATIHLEFQLMSELNVSGAPDSLAGELRVIKHDDSKVSFGFESAAFCFSGVCGCVVIGEIGVLASFDPNHREPRGPRLFSHHNVWNTCLLLLRDYGYTLRASGDVAHRNYPSRLQWHASKPDGTRLSADTPIELLSLAALHRHHMPDVDKDYWWYIDGPPLLKQLIDEWQEQSRPK